MLRPQTFWEKFCQFFLAVSNVFSVLYGFGLVVLGVISKYNPETPGYTFSPVSIYVILVGALLLATSVLGCCGASCESRRMTFSSVLLVAQIVLIIYSIICLEQSYLLAGDAWGALEDTRKAVYRQSKNCYDGPGPPPPTVPQPLHCVLHLEHSISNWYLVLTLSLVFTVALQVFNLFISFHMAKRFPSNAEKLEYEMTLRKMGTRRNVVNNEH